jgi:hypothetical protein
LAAEALAGLAAKEDFSNVQLKKNNTTIPHQDMVPHKTDCMLLQVKLFWTAHSKKISNDFEPRINFFVGISITD